MEFHDSFGHLPDSADLSTASLDAPRFLRMSEVSRRTALSVSALYALIACGLFPPFVALAPRVRGLLDWTLDAWLCWRLVARDGMRTLRDPVVLPRWDPSLVSPPLVRGVQMLRLSEVVARVGFEKTPFEPSTWLALRSPSVVANSRLTRSYRFVDTLGFGLLGVPNTPFVCWVKPRSSTGQSHARFCLSR